MLVWRFFIKFMKIFNREIKLCGTEKSSTLRVLARDYEGKILLCSGTAVPTGAGYAKSCLFIKTDAASGTKGLYENQGTTAEASFNLVGDIVEAEIGTGAVTVTKLANNAVETAKIKDANVSLAKLATAIAPSHIVKFVKLGSEITTTALAGLAVGDLIISIVADGTVTVGTCATIDTLPADPADTTYLVVLRATA